MLATLFASLLRMKVSVWDNRYMTDFAVFSAFGVTVPLLSLGFKGFFGCESSIRST
jgi:hypothetical protein